VPEIPWVNVLIGPRMVETPAFIVLGLWIVFQLISGMMHMLRSGARWRDCPPASWWLN
jgi:hypothetical protein